MKKTKNHEEKKEVSCADKKCPIHGTLSARGRTFEGRITKKFEGRIVIEFERPLKIRKYDRYAKDKSRIHSHLPKCMQEEVKVGDLVKVKECRPLSKIIHSVLIKKIKEGIQ
ncbi:30S ribosomal protein S17 [Candidatus Pacearchaeota archaeon CG10_big_fil_rev_8_21_14_0_10_35_13]|nr:MAG: 30S ribosomal protein S17 [Candidatus Pacearchaeota archaeon CG10_big_fil_rev_8_21_14_0_10_35_13]